ncbi:MAG TPA: hypothetical protein VFW28_00720 [Micropepsaceae bacterium]|nr:hypothetical protein [Micropepsaceae bacterium]
MRKHYAILAGPTFALTVAGGGIALAQYNPSAPSRLIGRPDPELKAAKQSLDDALAHLQKARNADSDALARVRGCIEVAESHIDPGFDSFGAAGVPLPPPNTPKPSCT